MQIILFKNDSESNETSIKTESKKIIAKLPTIEQCYSRYISHNPDDGGNSADYYQNIYFPLMTSMGFADSIKYEVYEDKFYNQYDHA
jgi:hypothetical protein